MRVCFAVASVASIDGVAATIARHCYRAPLAESVKLVNPAARWTPIERSTDTGCRTILRREPPISTLAPKPGPNAALALAPT
jgi:hypothetical protein